LAQALREDGYMPYAPLNPVLDVIRRFRERGLPEIVNRQVLHQLGAAEGNSDRIHKALQYLDLLDANGHRTQFFDRLGKAAEPEYPAVLGEIVRAAYSQILTIVDPNDGDMAINDAFRHYEPAGQRRRMVALFLGLCREAGMVSGGPVERKPRPKKEAVTTPLVRRAEHVANRGTDPGAVDEAAVVSGADYRLLSALIQQLPRDGKWSKGRRDRWLQAFTSNIDLLVELEPTGGGAA
jgi:hypothetical protein